jgi:hypothetical protein
MLFSSKNITTYLLTIGVIFVANYYANSFKQAFEPNDEYDLIRKYLLNETPLYGYNRPKLWIHSKYEINARKWKDFYSRNSTDLNQPYLHLTIKSILDHCADDFNICLIDDQSFSKLIPTWDIDITSVAEPMKSHLRELGMLQLIYYYGGMTVPNSFICKKNLKTMYENGIANGKPFVCENINRTENLLSSSQKKLFAPDTLFMGAKKNDETIQTFIEYAKAQNTKPHFTSEFNFIGNNSKWCLTAIQNNKMNLLGGELIGVKTEENKQVLLEDLMEEAYIKFHPDAVGVYIPADEILIRPKFQWFAVMPSEQLLQTNMIVSKHLLDAISENVDEYKLKSEIRSVVAI